MNELDMHIFRLHCQLRDNAAALSQAQQEIERLKAKVADLETAPQKAPKQGEKAA